GERGGRGGAARARRPGGRVGARRPGRAGGERRGGGRGHAARPAPRRPLVDRAEEVATARDVLLRARAGPVTLTGPGGVGKTRVALEVGARLVERFADGAAFVSLEAVTDPGQVATAVAAALGVPEAPGRAPAAGLVAYLRPRELLLILDNLEQLLPAAPPAGAAPAAAPRLKLLATSREPLRLRGEQPVPVPPLALPDPAPGAGPAGGAADPAALAALARVPAVACFLAYARQAR